MFYFILFYSATLPVNAVLSRKNDILLNVTAVQGQKAELPCRVSGDSGDYLVIWMNPKKILLSQRESRFIDDPRMSIERPGIGDWNLLIRSVKYEDRGEYTCTVNTPSIETIRVKLIVKVPPEINEYLSSNTVVRVREGEDVTLRCNASGKPLPTITWYRLTSDKYIEKKQVGTEGDTLIIHNISRFCGGIYMCEAFNHVAPNAVREIRVDVQFPPEIELINDKLGQYLGKETILVCAVSASPQAVSVWKKGNRRIEAKSNGNINANYRIELYPENVYKVTLFLRIRVITSMDIGNYTCEASNKLGSTSATMELYEYKDPVPDPTTTTTTISPYLHPRIKWTDYGRDDNNNVVYFTNTDNKENDKVISNGQLTVLEDYPDNSHRESQNSGRSSSTKLVQSKAFSLINMLILFLIRTCCRRMVDL